MSALGNLGYQQSQHYGNIHALDQQHADRISRAGHGVGTSFVDLASALAL